MKQNLALQSLWLAVFATAVTAQSVFINQVPLYASLTSCAEAALSTVVRDMYSGCGDGGSTTSYSCFCTASSSHFASIISTAVDKACSATDTSAASTATVVFNSYCHLYTASSTVIGSASASASAFASASASATLSVVTTSATSTMIVTSILSASTLATPTTSNATPSTSTNTAESTTATKEATSGLSSTARTAIIAVCIVVGVLGLVGIAVFLLMRRRKQARQLKAKDVEPPSPPDTDVKPYEPTMEKVAEVDSNDVYEADASQPQRTSRMAELPS